MEIAKIVSKKKMDQQKYVDTSGISVSQINSFSFETNKSRANLTPLENSIIFTKLKNQDKLYPIFNGEEKEFVFSTGFMNIDCKEYSSYIYGWLISDDYLDQKNSNSTGTLMEGISNGIFEKFVINKPKQLIDNSWLKYLGLLSKIKNKLDIIINKLIDLYIQ